MSDRCTRIKMQAAIGKRVGRDVDDSGDARLVEAKRAAAAIEGSDKVEHEVRVPIGVAGTGPAARLTQRILPAAAGLPSCRTPQSAACPDSA